MGYIKNLKESFKYAIKDIADDYVPQLSDAVSSIYDTARNFRTDSTKSSGVKSILSGVSKLPIFNELTKFANSSFDAIKTGRIYGDVGMGFDDSFSLDSYSSLLVDEDYDGPDAGIDDDRSTSSWGSDDSDKPIVSNDSKFNAKVTYDVSKASTSSLMKTMINNHIDNKMFMTRHNTDVMTGFSNANASLEMLNKFNNDIMKSYVEQSIKYYGDSMSVLNDIKKSLHYATDESSGMGNQSGTWIDMLNNGNYSGAFKDIVYRGGNRATGGMFSLMMSMLPMMIGMYAMNPGSLLVEKVKELLENKAGFKGLKKMSESISQLGNHAANATEKAMYSDNKYLANIASGIYVRDYADKNLKKGFKKGPVPWDMTSKTTLEVVIPGLLNKIATGITGLPASIYDMKDESWKSSEQIASEVKQRGPNASNYTMKLKRVLRSGLKVENEDTYNEIVEQLTRALLEKNLTLESLTKGGMGQNKQGYEKFLSLLGNIPGIENVITKSDFAKIVHSVDSYKHGKHTSGDYNEIVNSMRGYHKQTARYHKDLKEESVERGYIHLINDLDGIMPTEFGGRGRNNKKVKKMSKLFTGDNANETDYTKLRGLINEAEKRGISVKDTQKMLKAFSSRSDYTDDEFEKYADHEVGMIDKIHQTAGSFMMNNEFMEKHFYNTKFFQKLTEGMATNIDNIIKNTISNPIDNYLSGKLGNDYKDIISQKINRTLSAAESKAVDSFTDEQFGDLNAEFAKIDGNTELSKQEKEKRKKELYTARMRGAVAGLSNLMGEISFPDKDNTTGESFLKRHKKTAGLLLAGTAGVMGGGAIWSMMKKIPAVALLTGGSLGFLAPVALAGLGLAGGIYAYKSGIIETIMGQAKDPEKRKEIMGKFFKNVLPSMGLGLVAGGLSTSLISQLPLVGGLMGPILGATIGVGTAIYSWKNQLFENMFGKKEGEEKKKKGILSMIGAGVPGVVGALGLSTIANTVGLTSVGGLLGSPILLASAGIASSILLEKDNIKKRLFGEGAEEHSFVKNMGIWLFGDKEKGKVGLLSRQFEKFGKYIDKAGENISDWFKDNIVENIKLGFKPFTETMGNIGNKILSSVMGGWDKMSDKMKEAMDKGFFKALSVTFEEKVINPISNRLGRMFNWIFGVAGKIISAPFKWFAKGFSGTTGEEQRKNAESEMDTVKESAKKNREELEEEYKLKDRKDKKNYKTFWYNTELDENGFAKPTANRSDFGLGGSIIKRFGRMFGKGGGESFFSQVNSLWGKLGLGDSNISSSGCGLMAMAMVVSYFKKSKINPKDLLSYAEKYKVKGDGIATGFFADVASAFNLDYEVFPARRVAPESILTSLKSNNRIIALLSENYNGKSKHYVYLKDTKGHDVIFSDPAGRDNLHMNIHALHSYAREYIVFSAADTKCESIKTTKTTWEKIKSKFSKRPTSTEDIAKEESRIQNASGLNLEEDETKATDKDSSTFTKGSGLFHMRHMDKIVDKLYTVVKKNHSNKVNTNKLSRVIKTQTNGVAYNLEYIKRLMVKHLGDLDNGEKPGTNGIDGKVKIKKYHPVLSFFSNLFGWGKDTMMGGIHGVAEAGKSIISGITDIVLAPVKPILDAVEGTVKFFTTTLPALIKKPFEMIGKVAGDAITGIVKGFGEVKDAIFGVVGDMWGATKEVIKDVYAISKGLIKTSFSFLTSLGVGALKLGWNTFAESRIGQNIVGGIGSFIGGALKGGGGILGAIGGLFKTAKEKLLPIQKVFVTGGKLEIIDKINSITAVGTVDMDAMKSVDNKTQAGKALENKEKTVNKSNGTKTKQIETKGSNKTQSEISRDKELKAEDKEQDIEDIEKEKDRKGIRSFLSRFGIHTKGRGKKDDSTGTNTNPSGKGFWDMLKGNFLGLGAGALGLGALGGAGSRMLRGLGKIGKGALGLGVGALGLGALGKVGGSAMSFLGHNTPLKYIPGAEWAIGNSGDTVQGWADSATGMVTKNEAIANALGVNPLDDVANSGYGMRASRFILNYKYKLNNALANGLKDSFEESQQRMFKQLEKTLGSKSYKAILKKHGIVQTTKDGVISWGEKASKKAAKDATRNPGMIERALQMLFSHPKVANLLSKHGMKKMSSAALKELAEKAVKAGAKKSSIIALRTAANFIPYANIVVAVGFFVWDYSTGFWNADEYFKVKKEDVTPKMRQISAMVKALQGLIASTGILFLVGLIPLEWILDWTKKWFFSESEIADMDKSRGRRVEEDRRKMIANIKDPTARAKAQQEYTDEQHDVYNTLIMKKAPKNGSYFTRDELTGKEEDAVKTIKLENAIKATKATGDSAVAMRTFWDSEIMSTRVGREKDRKNAWYKLGGWDTKGLADDYAAMQMFTKDSGAMLELNRSQAMKYTFANGYTYQEVGCIPSSLADIYRSLGYEPNEMEMAMTADYYANYLNGGSGVPVAYAVDMAVLDGFGVTPLTRSTDIDAQLANGNRVLMLTKYNGSNHAVAIVGKTDEGRYMVYDKLRSAGPIYMDPTDPAFKAMTSAIAIGNSNGKDFEYKLDKYAYIKMMNPNTDFNTVGKFANISAMMEAKAWAKTKIRNKETNKPKDFNAVDTLIENKYADFGKPAGMSKSTFKNIMIRDLFNDMKIEGKSISYGRVKTKDGKYIYGNFETGKNGVMLSGGKATMITADGKSKDIDVDVGYYGTEKKKEWGKTSLLSWLGNNTTFERYDKSNDFVISGLGKDILTNYGSKSNSGYVLAGIDINSGLIKTSGQKDIKLKDGLGEVAQGPIDLARRNTLLNQKLNFNKALDERFKNMSAMSRSKSIQQSTSSSQQIVKSEIKEIIKTDKVENLLESMLKAIMLLVELQKVNISHQAQPQMAMPSIDSNSNSPDAYISAIDDILHGNF